MTICAGADESCSSSGQNPRYAFVSPFFHQQSQCFVQVAQLHDRMQAAASRGAEEVDELRGGYEDCMSAMRAELQQQEVDKAALLDIVQVGGL